MFNFEPCQNSFIVLFKPFVSLVSLRTKIFVVFCLWLISTDGILGTMMSWSEFMMNRRTENLNYFTWKCSNQNLHFKENLGYVYSLDFLPGLTRTCPIFLIYVLHCIGSFPSSKILAVMAGELEWIFMKFVICLPRKTLPYFYTQAKYYC